MDAFELYYRQADTDGDGKISGAEAVSFFKGTGLPQILLAKIWQYADQTRQGFLTKDQFIYALKLVTIAQSGRDLTPEIVKAVSGQASLQIPAPRIGQAPQPQSPLYRPPSRPNAPEQKNPSLDAAPRPSYQPPSISSQPPQQSWRPQAFQGGGLGVPTSSAFQSVQPVLPVPRPEAPSGPGSQAFQAAGLSVPANSMFQSVQAVVPVARPEVPTSLAQPVQAAAPVPVPSLPSTSALQATPSSATTTAATANGSWGYSDLFGGDSFKASVPAPSSEANRSAIVPVSSAVASASPTPQALVSPRIPTPFVRPVAPVVLSPTPQMPAVSGLTPVGAVQPSSVAPWPKMSPSDVQRYSRVFTDADTDRDGKIRGDQARDLFLSWRLPRDVLKQIWDLSDQDGDSMLSFQEFCIALYFMERYREGRPVPPVLPAGFLPDGPLSRPWTAAPAGAIPQRSVLPGSESAGLMPLEASASDTPPSKDLPYKSRVPPLELQLVNQLNKDDQETLKSKYKEAEEADKKVFELDRDIADARAKIDFYRAKLQEIILFKTRSDNHLLEITERVKADRREVELLRRRYDLKFQQAGETNSRLLAEEAAFRDLQQRKMELYNAIAKIDKGQKADELQERAEEISSELNDLRMLLNQRAKGMGLRTKPTSAMELPFGWLPGIQEKATDWDEWGKFADEGFVYFQKTEEPESQPASASSTQEDAEPKNEKNGLEPPASSGEKVPESHTEKTEQPVTVAAGEQQQETGSEKEGEGGTTAPKVTSTWDSVFNDEDFAKPGGLMGLKSINVKKANVDEPVPETPLFKSEEDGLKPIKTSDVKKPALDESVPSTPLFKSDENGHDPQQQQLKETSEIPGSVPETPLFKAETGGNTSQQDFFAMFEDDRTLDGNKSSRAGDESVPDTPLFKAEGSSSSTRSPFALFDSFNSFNYPTGGAAAASPVAAATFEDHASSKGSNDHRQASGFSDDWSTFS